jgi:hypothetical protein
MPGIAGKSGRKKKVSTLINEAVDRVDQKLPELFEALIGKALTQVMVECPNCQHEFERPGGGDKEAQIYLIDRRLGKPKLAVDVTANGDIGAGMLVKLFTMFREEQKRIESGTTYIEEPVIQITELSTQLTEAEGVD